MANIVLDFLHNYQTGERRETEPANAYQYDEGHVLEAVLPEVITACEIHYWIRGMEEADAYEPTSITPNEDDSCTVLGNIPNKYFETNGELRIYIVVTDGTASITTYEGKLHICQRSMPDDYVDDDPDNEAVRVIAEARAAAATATAAAETAQDVADSIPADYTQLSEDVTQLKEDLQDIIDHGTGGGMSAEFKQALHNIFEKVAYIDGNGQDYLDALDDAMSAVTAISLNTSTLSFSSLNSTQPLIATTTPSGGAVSWSSSNTSVATVSSSGVVTSVGYGTATITATSGSVSASCSVVVAQATLVSIACVYTQSGTVYESTSLDSLKNDLAVTASWNNGTTSTVASTDYELSGTLTEGTSTITVTYGGKTTTFNVTVTSANNYVAIGSPTIENGILTVENGKYVRSNYALTPTSGQSWKIRQKFKYNNLPSGFTNIIGGSDDDAYAKTFIVQENSNHQYIMYFSADMSAWTVSNRYTDNMPLAVDTWYYFEIGYTGTKYYMELKTGGWEGTRVLKGYTETASNVLMYGGKYVGFGVTSTVSGFDGQIDLNDCSIYVDDVLVWQAIAA